MSILYRARLFLVIRSLINACRTPVECSLIRDPLTEVVALRVNSTCVMHKKEKTWMKSIITSALNQENVPVRFILSPTNAQET